MTADIAAVLKHEFGVGEFGTPGAEGIEVEHVVAYHVDVDADGSGVVLLFQTGADEGVRVLYAVYEARAALDHALIDQLVERLVIDHFAVVVEEFVPETAVDEMACGVFAAADVEVYGAPVFVGLAAYKCLFIAWIHVAEIVGR